MAPDEMSAPEDGLYAYVFIRNADEDTIENLRGLIYSEPPEGGGAYGHYLFELSGPDDAMLVVHAPDLSALQQFVSHNVRKEAGARSTSTAVAIGVIIHWIKIVFGRRFEAIVRGRLAKGAISSLTGHLEEMPEFMGGATVLGEYDVILEFGADEYGDLVGALETLYGLEELHWSITGVTELAVSES